MRPLSDNFARPTRARWSPRRPRRSGAGSCIVGRRRRPTATRRSAQQASGRGHFAPLLETLFLHAFLSPPSITHHHSNGRVDTLMEGPAHAIHLHTTGQQPPQWRPGGKPPSSHAEDTRELVRLAAASERGVVALATERAELYPEFTLRRAEADGFIEHARTTCSALTLAAVERHELAEIAYEAQRATCCAEHFNQRRRLTARLTASFTAFTQVAKVAKVRPAKVAVVARLSGRG